MRSKVNWTAVSALAALVGVGILFWQVRQQAALSRFTTGIDSLWRLDDRWDTAGMVETRRKAAASLLAKTPAKDVDDVLDFFELLALLVNRQVLDPEMAWHAYYWPLANYWAASAEYVREARHEEGSTTWQDLEGLVRELAAIEARKRHLPSAQSAPTAEQTEQFLQDEIALRSPP